MTSLFSNFNYHSTYGIVDITLDDLFSSGFEGCGIGIELTGIVACKVRGGWIGDSFYLRERLEVN